MARRSTWRRYRGVIAVGVLAAIGLGVFLFVRNAQPEAQATTYQTEQAQTGTLSVTVAGTGNLAVRESVDAWPKTSGTVKSMEVSVGTSVKKGQVLYTLDAEDAEQATAQALAQKRQAWESVERAKLSLSQAEDQLADLKDKADDATSTVTSAQLDEAEQQVDVAEAGLSSAYASYQTAKLAYEDAVDAEGDLAVTAPCTGRVWEVNAEAGDSVSGSSQSASASNSDSNSSANGSDASSDAPVVIAKGGKLGAELSVNEVDITAIEIGQEAELTFDAVPDLTITGKVDEVGRDGAVDQGVVTYSVWVTLDVNDKRLKTGMSTSATIVTAVARNVLLVPNAAIKTSTDSGSYVQVLDAGATTPTNVSVTCGLAGSSQTVVEDGLEPGVAVVTKTVTADSSSGSSSGTSGRQEGPGAGATFMMGGGPPGAGQ